MNLNKLKKLAGEIRSLRRKAGSVHDRELVSIAQSLGRKSTNTSGHPQYVSDLRRGRITIPSHSKPLAKGTTLAILADLETDVFYWRRLLRSQKADSPNSPRIEE
jgi:predicted RNA binding protein YcfA (HicA-like mRNA interferase family)